MYVSIEFKRSTFLWIVMVWGDMGSKRWFGRLSSLESMVSIRKCGGRYSCIRSLGSCGKRPD